MEMDRSENTVYLADKNCALVSVLSCQGPIIPRNCDSPVCPKDPCLKKDTYFKTLADKRTKVLIDPTKYGVWITNDTRVFMISHPNDARSFVDSLQACCAVGLKLLSLHQDVLYSILVGAFNNASIRGEKFWTAATDEGCKKIYGFCSSSRLFRDNSRWAKGQPDLKEAYGTCLAVSTDGFLHDEMCTTKMRYVCEGRVQTTSLFDAVERECALEYKLTSSEVNRLFNSTPEELREKCFLKCYGEGTGLIVDGNLATDTIFSIFQKITVDDTEKLLDMSSTVDFCTNASKGMDPCDVCASLLHCGQENSPNIINDFVETVESSITESPLFLPPVKGVCPEYECYRKAELAVYVTTAQNFTLYPYGSSNVYQATFACNKKFFAYSTTLKRSLAANMAFCCDRGMRLVTIDSKQKYDCMVQSKIVSLLNVTSGTLFAVAASRLGKLDRPTWCYSDKEFDLTLAPDFLSSDTLENNYAIAFSFDPPFKMQANQTVSNIVCEV
ncbi:uncharacterized protein LOC135937576 [Cloeon dipterum]|uniref:uncharacterized protein LOC135937576 n=1 Tax=Cloeon dipterum TaxID=197152 RepID=UPI00321F9007